MARLRVCAQCWRIGHILGLLIQVAKLIYPNLAKHFTCRLKIKLFKISTSGSMHIMYAYIFSTTQAKVPLVRLLIDRNGDTEKMVFSKNGASMRSHSENFGGGRDKFFWQLLQR